MSDLFRRFDNVFFEKTRLSMMTILYQEGRASFTMFKERLQATDGAIYTHLEKLVTAGYATKRKEIAGTDVQTVYSPTELGRERFGEYLHFIEEVLESSKEQSSTQNKEETR